MIVKQCLLDSENHLDIHGKSIAQWVVEQGKQHLWSERERGDIDTVVVHYMSAINSRPEIPFEIGAVLELFCIYGVSSHYLIDREGITYQLVPEEKKAWHCGGSIMPPPDNRQAVNEFSLGIELMATHNSGFTEEQYQALAVISNEIERRWPIKTYLGHEDIAGKNAVAMGLRKDAKSDPGALFDWEKFNTLKVKKTG